MSGNFASTINHIGKLSCSFNVAENAANYCPSIMNLAHFVVPLATFIYQFINFTHLSILPFDPHDITKIMHLFLDTTELLILVHVDAMRDGDGCIFNESSPEKKKKILCFPSNKAMKIAHYPFYNGFCVCFKRQFHLPLKTVNCVC